MGRNMIAYSYEYFVMRERDPDEPHRGPWTQEECVEWIREGEEDLGMRPGAFYVAFRAVGPWIRV